jgi:hypothetical protein
VLGRVSRKWNRRQARCFPLWEDFVYTHSFRAALAAAAILLPLRTEAEPVSGAEAPFPMPASAEAR